MTISPETLAHLRDHYFIPQSDWAKDRIARVLNAVHVQPGERVLDLGCANATFSFHTAKLGARPIGIDRDASTLGAGREAARMLGGADTPRVIGDARRLPFRDGAFDVVINADFIEHVLDEDKEPIFREMHRTMKEGGRGVVYTPNRTRVRWELAGEHLKRFLGMRRERVPSWRHYVDPDHFGLTTPALTRRRLVRAGFDTKLFYFEFCIPLLSKVSILDRLLKPFLSGWFANRFLIQISK